MGIHAACHDAHTIRRRGPPARAMVRRGGTSPAHPPAVHPLDVRRVCRLAAVGVLVTAFVLACRRAPDPGSGCTRLGMRECFDGNHALTCSGFRWQLEACRGVGGCAHVGDADRCDQSLASTGDDCSREGTDVCSTSGHQHLRCEGGKMQIVSTCDGPAGCRGAGPEIACDDSSANGGDPCLREAPYWNPCQTAPENVVGATCSNDGKQLLLCSKERYRVTGVCRGPRGCTGSAGHISCDFGPPEEGDACSIRPDDNASTRCSADETTVLACNASGFGHFVVGARCKGRCLDRRGGAECTSAAYFEVGDTCRTYRRRLGCTFDGKRSLECVDGRMQVKSTCPTGCQADRSGDETDCS